MKIGKNFSQREISQALWSSQTVGLIKENSSNLGPIIHSHTYRQLIRPTKIFSSHLI
jgi:hypothetical protein